MTEKVVRPHPEGMVPPVPEGTVFRNITAEEAEHIFTPLSPEQQPRTSEAGTGMTDRRAIAGAGGTNGTAPKHREKNAATVAAQV